MKLLNKFRFSILLASLSLLLFASCEDKLVREESPASNINSTNVYFATSNKSSIVLGVSATTFDVIVSREKTTTAQSVALSAENAYGAIFSIPSTVDFAAGEAQKTIKVTVSNMEMMKPYHIAIEIDGDQTKPYTAQTLYPRIEITVLKEDFAPYANGTFSDYFFAPGDDYITWPLTLEYSALSKIYRLKACWLYTGYDLTFTWDKASVIGIIGTTSTTYKVVQTGYVHSSYGMVSAYFGACTYNATTKTFTFPITWRVAAGSFGMYPDYYQITSLL